VHFVGQAAHRVRVDQFEVSRWNKNKNKN
jgi:hypothetical protein